LDSEDSNPRKLREGEGIIEGESKREMLNEKKIPSHDSWKTEDKRSSKGHPNLIVNIAVPFPGNGKEGLKRDKTFPVGGA